MNQEFCLVLAIWGDAYADANVNVLYKSAKEQSPHLGQTVLLTDRMRPEVDKAITQVLFPAFFNRPEFFEKGYRVKLAIFSDLVVPEAMPCVYLDLDTLVVGDVGRIASLVKRPSDIFMLPPGSLLSFGWVRRMFFVLTQGRRYAVGNSSVVAFHSGAKPSIAELFETHYRAGEIGLHMQIDDIFISWAAQTGLRGVPNTLAVMFRREFLSRSSLVLLWRRISPLRQKRREGMVAITFNGTQYKPIELLSLKPGDRISDSKGRFGFWSDAHIGALRYRIIAYCRRIHDRDQRL